jgi:hypothetical protein
VVGFTIDSREEVPGERKPMIRDDDDNQVCKIIHQKLAYKYGLLNKTTPYYIPNTILENETIKLY